jgi:HK97 family phage major capsid protein
MPETDFLTSADEQILAELRRSWREEFDTSIGPLRKRVDALIQRSSRGPGAGLEHAALGSVESVGQKFIGSEELKALLSAPGQRGRAIVNVASLFGSREQKDITNATTIAPTVRLPGVVAQPRRALRLRDLIPVRPYDVPAGSVDYLRQSPRTTAAAPQVAEGDVKAEVQIATTLVTSKFSTIACWTNASRQILMDIDLLMAFINSELLYQTQLEEEREILVGTGAANGQLDGLLPAATAFNPALSLAGDTNLDLLNRAETQLLTSDVQPTAFVLNPLDMSYIETLKTTLGSYLANEPGDGDFGDSVLWGLPVVQSNSMPAGQFVVGDFRTGCTLLDRMTATVELSTENADNFVRNLVTIRAEERVALLTFSPWSFVKGTFAAPGTATSGTITGPKAAGK